MASLNDFYGMILHWTVDQHGGQAKGVIQWLAYASVILMSSSGLGLHLQHHAREQPDRFDLHQPECKLITLTAYEHLHCLLHLCTVHGKHNICNAHFQKK